MPIPELHPRDPDRAGAPCLTECPPSDSEVHDLWAIIREKMQLVCYGLNYSGSFPGSLPGPQWG